MPKIKLAFVTHGLSTGGIESFLMNIIHYLDMNKYDVTFLVAIDKDNISTNEEKAKTLGAKVINICDLDGIKKKMDYSKLLKDVFEKEKFDIVHANMDLFNGLVLSVAKKANVKKRICHSHTSSSIFLSNNHSFAFKLIQSLYKNLMKHLILISSTKLLACSNKASEYLYGKRNSEVVIINNGIDLKQYNKNKKIKIDDIPDDKINLLTAGHIVSVKNPLFIVDIIKELSLLRQDFVFNWAGDGSMKEEIQQAIKNNKIEKYFNMLGRRTDIPEILSNCSYFLLPSLFEGLPVSLVEAQSAGLYCFVSDSVSNECDLGGCRFIPLELGSKKWAEIINEAINEGVEPNINRDKLSKFDISYTVKQLDEIYSQ